MIYYYKKDSLRGITSYRAPKLYKLSDLAKDDDELLDPTNYTGHLIEKGIVLCVERGEVLLLRHRGDDIWFTPNSHINNNYSRAGATVIEAIEQLTEIDQNDLESLFNYSFEIREIDIQTVLSPKDPQGNEPQHIHFEFVFAFDYNGPKEINTPDNIEYKWVSLDDPSLKEIINIDRVKSIIEQPKFSKVMLDIMHSSPEIPDWDRFKYRAELEKKILKNTAWFTDRLFSSEQCYSFVYPHSRYYCDIELPDTFINSWDNDKPNMIYPNSELKNRYRKELTMEDKNDIAKTCYAHYRNIENENPFYAIILHCSSFSSDDPQFEDADIYISCQSKSPDVATFKAIKKCFSQFRVVVESEYYDFKPSRAISQEFTIKVNKRLYMEIANGKPRYIALSDVRKAILNLYDTLLKRPLTKSDYARNLMSEQEIMAINEEETSNVLVDDRWGVWYRDKLLIEAKYKNPVHFYCGLACVEHNGKWGYMDKLERMVIPAIYDYTSHFTNDLALVLRDNEWILIDCNGLEITHFKRDYVDTLKNDVFIARVGDKWGHVNAKDEELTEFKYDKLKYSQWRLIKQNNKCGLLNLDCSVAIDCIYDSLTPYSYTDETYCVQQGNKFGMVNNKGEVIVPLIFDQTYTSNQISSATVVRKGRKYGVYNHNGEMLLDLRYDDIKFSDETFVLVQDKKYGLANLNGEIILSPTYYDYIGEFEQGVSIALKDQKYSIINKKGETLTLDIVEYDTIRNFYDGMAQVINEGKSGFINTKGELAIPFYDDANCFNNGLAKVCQGDLYGYINKENEVLVDIKYTELGNFRDGYAEFTSTDGRKGIIDTQGKEIYSYQNINPDDFRHGKFGL